MKKLLPFAVILAAALLLLYLPDIGPDRYTDLGTFFKTELKRQAYTGYAVAVVEDGSVLYVDAFGKDGSGKALTTDTAMPIGAVSKTFTGLVTLSLVRENLVSIDKPVIEYLPWFALGAGGPAAGGTEITLRHLLSHTAGVSDRDFDDEHARAVDLEAAVKPLALARPRWTPGTKTSYLDTDYDAVALTLEAATGLSYSDLVFVRIFRPLGMARSSVEGQKVAASLPMGSGCFFGAPLPRRQFIPAAGAPSSYIISTVGDLSKYLAYLAGPEKLARTPVPARYLPILYQPLEEGSPYAYGWRVEGSGPDLVASHVGSLEGFSSNVSLRPGHRSGIAILVPQNSLLQSLVALPALTAGAEKILADGQTDKPFPLVRLYILLAVIASVHVLAMILQTGGALSWSRDVHCRAEASGSRGPVRFAVIRSSFGIVFRVALIAVMPYILSLIFERRMTWNTAFSMEPGLAAWFMAVAVLGALRNVARLSWLRGPR